VDTINDPVLGREKGQRYITSQHILQLESLLLNYVYLPASAKQPVIYICGAETIWGYMQ